MQYHLNKEAAKISALSSGKMNKYKDLTGEEILPPNKKQIIEQAKLAYSPSEKKVFEKQTEKLVNAMKSLDPSKKIFKIESISPVNLMNYLIRTKLKEIDHHSDCLF